jgi:hypothetical protein
MKETGRVMIVQDFALELAVDIKERDLSDEVALSDNADDSLV